MGKINRFLCCLILPIIAMFCFAGCEKDKTKEDIANKLSAIKETYKIELESGDFANEMFDENGLLEITYVGNEIAKIYDSSQFNENKFSTDINLYKRYYELINLQHKVLNNTMIYYNHMNENFYEKMDISEVKTQDINEIHARLEDFEDALKTFNVAKDKFEQTVEVLTFGGVVRADLTSYSFSLNVLIEEAIEFNEFFKNLNEKYLFNGEITDSNKSLFIGHYFYEYGHKINELVYYKYLKSFNNVNECDLSSLYDSQVFKNDNIIKDYYMNGTHLAQMLPERVDYINSDYSSEDVEIFKEIRDGFLQKFDIYKLVYSNMNYYEYNANFIQGQAKVDEFEKELSSVEKANINIVEKFYETTVLDYCSDDFWSKSVLYL